MAILDGEDPYDVDLPNDKKKSGVTFNETVERIEVLTEVESKNNNLSRDDDEVNDSRL